MVTHGDREERMCGLPLVLVWALQIAIDDGRLTAAEASAMIRECPRPDPATT